MAPKKKMSRRDAIGMIGKTGLSLSTAQFFFLSLNTQPLAGRTHDDAASDVQVRPPRKKPLAKPVPAAPAEKVMISGSGTMLTFRISGPPGRHCAVSYAMVNKKAEYRPLNKSRKVIEKNGSVTIPVDVSDLPNQKLFFRVVTGATADFTRVVRGTKVFEVVVAGGKIARFVGVSNRSLSNASAVASAATACYAARK